MSTIKVAINGYGNLGRGVEKAIAHAKDMELVAVFTRRDPESVTTQGAPVVSLDDVDAWADKVDVVVNCGGSATDLHVQTPIIAKKFNVVDSFDTHAKIPEHFEEVNKVAEGGSNLALISGGWDPGFFSLLRVYGAAFLPESDVYTFWGPGLSQGHSDAVRRIEGVKKGVQYTIPVEEARQRILGGEHAELTVREKHERVVYLVAEDGADKDKIRDEIVNMPNYFDEYNTTVNFISDAEFDAEHTGMPHGGDVIRLGKTSEGVQHVIHFNLKLDSNPEFTGSVLVACARAVVRMNAEGAQGAITLFDVPPAKLHQATPAELRAHML